MSPEFGSTAAIFPISGVTTEYLRLTGRDEQAIALVEQYAKQQGLWHDPANEPNFSEYMELNLGTVVPSIAGPKRPQDRILLSDAKSQFEQDIVDYADPSTSDSLVDLESKHSFPASDPGAGPGDVDGGMMLPSDRHEHESWLLGRLPTRTLPRGSVLHPLLPTPSRCTLTGPAMICPPGSDLRQTSLATGPLERPWEHTIPRSCLPTPSVTARSSTSWSTLACEPYKISDFS